MLLCKFDLTSLGKFDVIFWQKFQEGLASTNRNDDGIDSDPFTGWSDSTPKEKTAHLFTRYQDYPSVR